jgi:uncharacterized DUF497 family protein
MEFEWDEAKSERNRMARGLPFALAIPLFAGFVLGGEDVRRAYGERRMIAIGRVESFVLACIYTDRGTVRRVISLRRANRKERNAYRSCELGRYRPGETG